ncbi:MAG: LETM1 domain-containing protein [SAR324 cluster bacterium]|mgnify:CR=1 FL=1|nr:LETM1 domain-containing protein [SAR324 cluster bacterium]|tara:strand:- start:587 stop:1963 length:1377 start_codon:yes stop_codon:yes gene_type:complete
MFSFAQSKSGWLRRYLLDRLQRFPEQPPRKRSPDTPKPSELEKVNGMLHQTAKQNGLLLGCPVLENSRYAQLEEFRFPEKSGDALMVYLDTLIDVGLAFLERPAASRGLPSSRIDPAEIEKKGNDLFQLIQLYLRYHLPRSHYRFSEGIPLARLLEEDETLGRALAQLEEALVEKITLKSYSSEGSRLNLFAFLQLYCCLRWSRDMLLEQVPSLEMVIQSEYRLREELILAFAALIWADGQVTEVEDKVFSQYIELTGLPEAFQEGLRKRVKTPVGIEELALSAPSPLLKHFLIEQMILLSLINNQEAWQEIELIEKIASQFGIGNQEMDALFLGTADFFDRHAHRFSFLRDNPSTREFQDYMNDKVMSQVKLNADRILREIEETKELYDLMLQATERSLSEEERIKVREQLTDIVKSIPALAIFALPGGGILLPILIRVLPFNILPSAFSDDAPAAR